MNKSQIKNLLNREELSPLSQEDTLYLKDKVVMVTGGGGSIGSELSRLISTLSVKKLIILDNNENGAYELIRQIEVAKNSSPTVVEIADITDKRKMRLLFKKYRPQIVFNASAHKHVPLMEDSPEEAVKTNVYGTLNLVRFAKKYGAEVFVQISTDKAVNPTSVMGATKLLCEKLISCYAKKSSVKFTAVRFGNVLGSNGSVIPIFEKQIENGGPITLTDKRAVRYFMTVFEAVSLLVTAGSICRGGEVFVLDMGEQVNIYDLAKKMVELSGKQVEILETGLRQGEKLFEEPFYSAEETSKTANGKINVVNLKNTDDFLLMPKVYRLIRLAKRNSKKVKSYLVKILPEYKNGQIS